MGSSATLMWGVSGFLSWWLATYFFMPVFLPLVHMITGSLSRIRFLEGHATSFDVLLQHFPEYILSFAFCLLLGHFSQSNKLRIFAFIASANFISLYYHLMQLAGYIQHHYQHTGAALTGISLGLISILIISPACAIAGSMAGTRAKKQHLK